MSEIILKKLLDNIFIDFGLHFDAKKSNFDGKTEIVFTIPSFQPKSGFEIIIEIGYRRLVSTFMLQDFSGELINLMNELFVSKKNLLAIYLNELKKERELFLRINDEITSVSDFTDFDESLKNIEIKTISKLIESDVDLILDTNINAWIMSEFGSIFSAVYPILPIEEETSYSDENIVSDGFEEGRKYEVNLTKYERNIKNREICLTSYGYNCQICNFDFLKNFGVIGSGYIHVHHLTPLSIIGKNYIIDPIKDLLPVCPNCHAMLHTQKPPIPPEILRIIVLENL
jgi:5-methylcytosine-specific restriction enzyme A